MTNILSYQKAYNLSNQYYPDFYPNESFYLKEKFLVPKSLDWQYPTVEGITPTSDFRIQKVRLFYDYYNRDIDRLRRIISDPVKLAECLKGDPTFYTRTIQNINAYDRIHPLAAAKSWKKAARLFFFLEKEYAQTLKETMPELDLLNQYPNDIIILRLPRDLESSWKKAAIIAYNYALNHKDTSPEFRELLVKKAGWLVNE